MQTVELLLRILLGTGLGAAIGFERDIHGRPAGLRTHAIVALAAATFTVISTSFTDDPSRIASSVVSGIGFLGAGAIFRTGFTIQGLTTAAGLWLVAAIGMAAGGGMRAIAIAVTVIGLVALTLLRRIEDRGALTSHQRLTLILDEKLSPVASVVAALSRHCVSVTEQGYERTPDEGAHVSFDVRTSSPLEGHVLAQALEATPGVLGIKVERL